MGKKLKSCSYYSPIRFNKLAKTTQWLIENGCGTKLLKISNLLVLIDELSAAKFSREIGASHQN